MPGLSFMERTPTVSQKYFEQLDPKTLRPLPGNATAFGDTKESLNPEFLESIKNRGVMSPVIVNAKKQICDGHRRTAAAIAAELDTVPCWVSTRTEPHEVMADWCELQTHQRVPTTEQRSRLAAMVAEHKAAISGEVVSSQIWLETQYEPKPEKEGRPKKQKTKNQIDAEAAKEAGLGGRENARKAAKVVEAIDAAETTGDTATAEALRDTLNNKSVDAATKQLAAIEEKKADPELTKKPTDKNGKVLPKHLIEIFEKRSLFKEVLNKLTQLQKAYNALVAEENAYATHKINKVQAQNDLKNFKNLIQFAQPHAICPYCKGTGKDKGGGCTACKGTCWVVETAYKAAPTELR